MRRLLLLSAAAVVLFAANLPAQNEDIRADERKLKDAYQDTDNASLVKFLKARSAGQVAAKELDALITELGDKDATVRNKARQQLIAIGAPAVPRLRLLARNPKASDAAELAKELLKVLEDNPDNVTGAAVRLLAARRPAGTAEALLAYLPHAENESVMEDIKAGL